MTEARAVYDIPVEQSDIQEIKVIELEEHDDGSATLVLELSEDTKCSLLGIGLNTVLRKYIETQAED